jgi:hypothetical protein
MLFRLVRQ